MKDLQRIGILTSIDWNSKRWREYPEQADIDNSNYDYVKKNGITHTYLNFQYENLAPESNEYIYALLPQFWSRTPQSEYIEVIFIRSKNWQDGFTYIVGFYLFPQIKGKAPAAEFPPMEREVNIKALANETVLLDEYIKLTKKNMVGFLPPQTALGSQGFNYLTIDNVLKIFDIMTSSNPMDEKLKRLKYRFLKSNGLAK